MTKAVNQYLSRYSTLIDSAAFCNVLNNVLGNVFGNDASKDLAGFSNTSWQQALVIPAFAETPHFLHRLAALTCEQHSLVILVINCPSYASQRDQDDTQRLIEHIKAHHTIENVRQGVTFGQLNSRLDLLSLDITVQREDWLKPLQSGVGFARKVGMDIATALWQQGYLHNPWVLNSDADAWWPEDYLIATRAVTGARGAWVLPYLHQQNRDSDTVSPAAALYELSLRYYVLGLRWSGSPWAYHTIGSTQAIHCESYAAIRGFPIREAGEDFYLLNKIAKIAPVHCPAGPLIRLSDRASTRVPFGTGPAVKRISEHAAPDEDFVLYEPNIFTELKRWHQQIPGIAASGSMAPAEQALSDNLLAGLQALGLQKALTHCQQQAKTAAQFQRHLWQWFDGFRTLKLVHWLRDHGHPSISYRQWRERAQKHNIPFVPWPMDNTLPTTRITQGDPMCGYLEKLEISTLPFSGGLQN